MSDQKQKSSWDDLAELLGAEPTSKTAADRHSDPEVEQQPEKPSMPPSAGPPPAGPPPAGPPPAGSPTTGTPATGPPPAGAPPAGSPPPRHKLGGWGTLASELGLSMPASPATDSAARSKPQRQETSFESSPRDRQPPRDSTESEPTMSQPPHGGGSAVESDSTDVVLAKPETAGSDFEKPQGTEADDGPPKERKRRRRGRRRSAPKEDSPDKVEASQPTPTEAVVEKTVEGGEPETGQDDSTDDGSATTQKRRRRRRGRGRGRRQRSPSGESAELHTPRSTDWLEESQDVANNEADDQDANNGGSTHREAGECDAPVENVSDAATRGDVRQGSASEGDAAEAEKSPRRDLGKRGDLGEKDGKSEDRETRRPRHRRGGRRRTEATVTEAGPREDDMSPRGSLPKPESSDAPEAADWTDHEPAESDVGAPEESFDSSSARRTSHKNIPSWDEAIGMIVEANLGNRTAARGRGARGGTKSRSRGRGRRN